MKFYVKLVAALVAIVALLWWLQSGDEPKPAVASSPTPAAASAPVAPPQQAAPTPYPAATPEVDRLRQAMDAAAVRARVTVVELTRNNDRATVTVQGPDRPTVMGFLDELQKEQIRDLDYKNVGYSEGYVQGRLVARGTFHFQF